MDGQRFNIFKELPPKKIRSLTNFKITRKNKSGKFFLIYWLGDSALIEVLFT